MEALEDSGLGFFIVPLLPGLGRCKKVPGTFCEENHFLY